MTKNKLFITVLLLIQSICFSQKISKDFTVSTSSPYEVIDAGSKKYVSLDDGTVIIAKMGRGLAHLQKFDVNKMKEVARNTYKDLPDAAFFQDIIKLENRVYYIFEAFDKKDEKYTVYCREIDTEKATFKPQTILLTSNRKVVNSPNTNGELTNTTGGFADWKIGGNKFLIYKSFDDSKVMINYRCYPINKKDAENYDELGFYVFDNKMQKIWGKEVKMPYTEAQINNIAYAVSSSGEAIMLVANRENKAYEVFLIDHFGELTTKKLGLSTDQFVKNLEIREDNKGNFKCAGYYANGIEFKYNPFTGGAFVFNANGLMYFEMDKEGKLLMNKNFDFSKDFIQQNLNESQKKAVEEREKDGKAGILDLILTNFTIKEDGSAYIVGERQYLRNEFWGPQQKPVYHFSNIIVIKVDKDGNLAWMKKLPKNQAGLAGCGQMSFSYMESKNADYVAFVDNAKNINLTADGGVPEAHKDGLGGFLTTYKINHETGDLEKHTICDLNNIKGIKAYQFKAFRILKAQEGVFLMEIYIKEKKDIMVKFVVN